MIGNHAMQFGEGSHRECSAQRLRMVVTVAVSLTLVGKVKKALDKNSVKALEDLSIFSNLNSFSFRGRFWRWDHA